MVSEGSTQRLYTSRGGFIILVYKRHGAGGGIICLETHARMPARLWTNRSQT